MLSSFRGIELPANSEFVLVDNTLESSLPTQSVNRIPLMMWINYNGLMPDPPAVTFLINPQTMNTSMSKKIGATFSRGGFIVEDWGENLDVINFNGTLGGYYVLTNSTTGTGLNRYDRNKSYSFRNLMEIFLIYRNNGAIYTNSSKNLKNNLGASKEKKKTIASAGLNATENRMPSSLRSVNTRISSVGDVYIQYDKTLYYGSFDSFNIDEDASRPYTLNYNFSFTVLRRSIADNRRVTYYNQVALDFSDANTSTGRALNTLRSVENLVAISAQARDQEAKTNPATFNQVLSIQNLPINLVSEVTTIFDQKGYQVSFIQQKEYEQSFKELAQDQSYNESQNTKQKIENTTRQVVYANSDKSDWEKNREALEISNTIINKAEVMKGSVN